MASVDSPRAATIATGESRFIAIFFTLGACLIAGGWVQGGPQWLRHAPRPAVVTYLVIVTVALIWGCFRGWRIELRIDDNGVTIRNFFRTHRFTWPEVSHFADAWLYGGESKFWWALRVVLRDGRTVIARGTTRSGPPNLKMLTVIGQAADRYRIPAELTGAASAHARARTAPPQEALPEVSDIILAEWAEWAGTRRFPASRLQPGYEPEEVDAFLEVIRDTFLGASEHPLTADEVRTKQFSTTRLRPGYDESAVDDFLDKAELRLAALQQSATDDLA
jgi:DivIVA domain-containing protein